MWPLLGNSTVSPIGDSFTRMSVLCRCGPDPPRRLMLPARGCAPRSASERRAAAPPRSSRRRSSNTGHDPASSCATRRGTCTSPTGTCAFTSARPSPTIHAADVTRLESSRPMMSPVNRSGTSTFTSIGSRYRGCLLDGLAHRHRAGHLKRDVLAVHAVRRTVNEPHLDVDDRVAGHRTCSMV